jgi:putative transposase
MHILIIEDEEQLCRSMAEGLRMDGYETDTCFDGEEGLELCMTENYDLILLDLNLPGIDGLEILRQFRTFNTNTPVLILSARVQIQDKVEGLDLGANDYLTKPFHFEELEARIRSLTRRKFIQEDVCLRCSRFLYNRMLADKIRHYQEEKKMLKNTPAGYKKEYPWLKEVDSLALANVQLNLEGAFRKFFREPGVGFPHYKSKKHSRKSYTTNMVNGNICLQDRFLKLPKMQPVKIKLHRMIPEGWKLKSVTVSREPSGKYFASLLFDCENQTAEKRQAEKFLGMDFAMHGMCVFSTGERAGYPMFYRNAEKKLAREQRKLSRCEKGSRNYQKQKKKVALYHEKIKNQRKDFQHKLSHSLAEDYDAVCVEDLNLKGMAGGLHFGKGIQDNGYGQFLSMLGYKLEERGKYLIKVDRYFASSKICSVCGHKKKELALSERIYLCECGNRMDRDVNAAVNILKEGKRIYKKCA